MRISRDVTPQKKKATVRGDELFRKYRDSLDAGLDTIEIAGEIKKQSPFVIKYIRLLILKLNVSLASIAMGVGVIADVSSAEEATRARHGRVEGHMVSHLGSLIRVHLINFVTAASIVIAGDALAPSLLPPAAASSPSLPPILAAFGYVVGHLIVNKIITRIFVEMSPQRRLEVAKCASEIQANFDFPEIWNKSITLQSTTHLTGFSAAKRELIEAIGNAFFQKPKEIYSMRKYATEQVSTLLKPGVYVFTKEQYAAIVKLLKL